MFWVTIKLPENIPSSSTTTWAQSFPINFLHVHCRHAKRTNRPVSGCSIRQPSLFFLDGKEQRPATYFFRTESNNAKGIEWREL
jgi:hypothetical protein